MKDKTRISIFIFLLLIFSSGLCLGDENKVKTAVLGAISQEIELVKNHLENIEVKRIMGNLFFTGDLHGRRIVLVKTGAGKVNSAMTTLLTIEHFKPEEVIFTGISGSINPDLSTGDIVIGEKMAQHDCIAYFDEGIRIRNTRNPVTGIKNPFYFEADERLLSFAELASKNIMIMNVNSKASIIKKGVIVTGDSFIASKAKKSELLDNYNADAVEMEGASVAQVCYQYNVPFLIIRGISDYADKNAMNDMNQYFEIGCKNSAELAMMIIELMEKEKE